MNAPQSRRFAQFEGVRQSRSVWTARVFSTAFRRGRVSGKSRRANFQWDGERFSFSRLSRRSAAKVDGRRPGLFRLLAPALSSFGEEREKYFCGTLSQGSRCAPILGCFLLLRWSIGESALEFFRFQFYGVFTPFISACPKDTVSATGRICSRASISFDTAKPSGRLPGAPMNYTRSEAAAMAGQARIGLRRGARFGKMKPINKPARTTRGHYPKNQCNPS